MKTKEIRVVVRVNDGNYSHREVEVTAIADDGESIVIDEAIAYLEKEIRAGLFKK